MATRRQQAAKARGRAHPGEDVHLTRGVRIAMLGAGIALVVLAALLWWPAPPATVQHRTETTTVTPAKPGPGAAGSRTTATTEVLNGRPDQAGKAQPGGSSGRRSETLTVALLAGALLLWLLAAIGRLPSKLSFGGGGVEYAPLTPREVQTLSAKVGEKATEQGIHDPGEVGSAIARAYNVAVVDKSRRVKPPPAHAEGWGAELAETYFDRLADEAVKAGTEE